MDTQTAKTKRCNAWLQAGKLLLSVAELYEATCPRMRCRLLCSDDVTALFGQKAERLQHKECKAAGRAKQASDRCGLRHFVHDHEAFYKRAAEMFELADHSESNFSKSWP